MRALWVILDCHYFTLAYTYVTINCELVIILDDEVIPVVFFTNPLAFIDIVPGSIYAFRTNLTAAFKLYLAFNEDIDCHLFGNQTKSNHN